MISLESVVEFIERLKIRLAGDLPGEDAQFRMAPVTRPRMKESMSTAVQYRHSAVLLYLFPQLDDWRVVLMKRPDYNGTHGGQVSIPGGRLEPGENHLQAALREFEEETGVGVSGSQLLGGLSELFIPPSKFLVKPFVAYAENPPCFDPDPVEVEAIIELSLPGLMSDVMVKQGRVCLSDGTWVETPYFAVGGHRVWGATAMILNEFKEVLSDLR